MTELIKLNAAEKLALCALADPAVPPPADVISADVRPDLFATAARLHGVDAVVLRQLLELSLEPPPWNAAIDRLRNGVHLSTALTLMLEAHADAIRKAFGEAGIAYRMVKGAAFAAALYPNLSDRPYTDVDIVVEPTDLAKAGDAMQALGFRQALRAVFDKSVSNREQKWVRDDAPNILIEIHTDIVHDPRLRRRLTFGFRQLAIADGEGAHANAAHLALAVMHAAAGHKFHVLKLLVDVAQALRAMTVEDAGHFARTCPTIGVGLELAQSMTVVRSLFPSVIEAQAWGVLDDVAGDYRSRQLILADTVLDAIDRSNLSSRWRRHAFRWRQIVQPSG